MEKKKVIIIGAGPAGLTAGLELLRANKNNTKKVATKTRAEKATSKGIKYEVTILEESNEITETVWILVDIDSFQRMKGL